MMNRRCERQALQKTDPYESMYNSNIFFKATEIISVTFKIQLFL